MTLQEYARAILLQPDLEAKLRPPPAGLEDAPGAPERLAPAREERLALARKVKVPRVAGMGDPRQRARILHAFANHELQAVELFAWAALAFPSAPTAFRRGLVAVLADEQRHLRLYIERLEAFGVRFGDYPLSGYFWKKTDGLTSPLAFVCAMGLSFEAANLDHSLAYATAARQAGDEESAALFERIHREEIAHVRFAWRWLCRLKPPGESAWDAFVAGLTWPLRPELSLGREPDWEARARAGLAPDFLAELHKLAPDGP